jgi:hypothetical protein
LETVETVETAETETPTAAATWRMVMFGAGFTKRYS